MYEARQSNSWETGLGSLREHRWVSLVSATASALIRPAIHDHDGMNLRRQGAPADDHV
jgi:hypothetical protein